MNSYAGVPADIKGRLKEAASKALENDVRHSIDVLERFGQEHATESVLAILRSLIGEADDQ